jgi:sigma-B regulation protein RsbU (phosphoserine phosphatase)
MSELGRIAIRHELQVREARNKTLRVIELLGGDEMVGTRVAAAVSEMTKQLLRSAGTGELVFVLSERTDGLWLALELCSEAEVPLRPAVTQMFARTLRPVASAGHRIVAETPLRRMTAPSAASLPRVRETLKQKDRGQLMAELQLKNRELQESFETLKRTTSAKERMESELNIGCEIQMSMLPVEFPAFPHRKEFDVYAQLVPAREVGGDFYDFFLVDEDHLCFGVGDVSGKGVPSALFMAVTKTLIKSRATNDFSPASILTHANDELAHHNDSCMFVTIFLAMLNVKTGRLTYCNAGHNPPYLMRDGVPKRVDARHGPVVGAVDGMTYDEDELDLQPGDLMLLYTDGVTEAMNAEQQLYSERRLVSLLDGARFETVSQAVDVVTADVWEYQGSAEQADDVTVLALEYFGEPRGRSMNVLELSIANDPKEIARVNGEFKGFAEEAGLPTKLRRQMQMVFDELLSNVISYGYEDAGAHTIELRVEARGGRLAVIVEDDGKPFNPFTMEAPDTELGIEERAIGGLGIHLVRNVMDHVSYQRRTDRNVVTLVKKYEAVSQ